MLRALELLQHQLPREAVEVHRTIKPEHNALAQHATALQAHFDDARTILKIKRVHFLHHDAITRKAGSVMSGIERFIADGEKQIPVFLKDQAKRLKGAAVRTGSGSKPRAGAHTGDCKKILDKACERLKKFASVIDSRWLPQVQEVLGHRPPKKPRIFIGSSTESLRVARQLKSHLKGRVRVTLWNDRGVFTAGKTLLARLIELRDQFHFAVFICAADDMAIIRETKIPIPRDNVVLELGMFLGCLPPNRVFIVREDGVRVPPDLGGLIHRKFVWPKNSPPSATQLRQAARAIMAAIDAASLRWV